MSDLRRLVYRGLVWLHPADFRKEFGREMKMDFEEAVARSGFVSLCGDAVVSLCRQWAVCMVRGGVEAGEAAGRRSLLAGEYVMIRDEHMTVMELGRGLIVSVTMLTVCGFGMRAVSTPWSHLELVHASSTISQPDQLRSSSAPGARAGDIPAATMAAGGRVAGTGAARPQFDVATVKQAGAEVPSDSNVGVGMNDGSSRNGGYLSATQPLAFYILFAYDLPKYRFGVIQNQLPEWAQTERFTIQARADGNPTKDEMRLMLRSLLADRFGLGTRMETRQAPAYSLVFAKPGRMGSHLRTHAGLPPCGDASTDQQNSGSTPTIPGGFPILCGKVVPMKASVAGDMRFAARDVTMGQIAGFANDMTDWGQLDRPVIGGTSESGTFDFDLEFMPVAGSGLKGRGGAADGWGATLQEALQRQLGLKLRPTTAPVNFFVIDQIHKPTGN